jgi:DNA replication licensing factor MCM5
MDRRTPYTLSVLAPSADGAEESRTQIQERLRLFVLEFQLDNAFIYRWVLVLKWETRSRLMPCRDQLRQNALVKQYYCDIDIAHLISYNEELAHKLTTEPADIIPLVSGPRWHSSPSLIYIVI